MGDITASTISALHDEAAAAGDLAQVAICQAALEGSADAWEECVRVIEAARAMSEPEGI